MTRSSLRPLAALLCLLPVLHAQAPAKPEFEVASVKPNTAGMHMVRIGFMPGGRFNAEGATLRMLVRLAYDVKDSQISGGPGWLATDAFDIQAKAPEGKADFATMKLMLQSLLTDRFHLTFHRESKEAPIYELNVAKAGSKLTPSASGSCIQPGPGGPTAGFRPGEKPPCGAIRMGLGLLDGSGVTMDRFLSALSEATGRPVVDKTGLTGAFDIHLTYTPDQPIAAIQQQHPDAPSVDPGGPSVLTAVQEQLGLRLDSAKGPVESLIVDRVEKPSEN